MATGELEGLRALVTGASKGIGYAVAGRLQGAGATVLATARTSPSPLPEGMQFVATDLTLQRGCDTVANTVRDHFGSIDIIVTFSAGRQRQQAALLCSTISSGSALST